MPLSKRIFLILAASSTLLAALLFVWQMQTAKAAMLAEQKNQLGAAEQKLAQLARDIQQYEAATQSLGGGKSLARHEKVALGARFAPGDLARIHEVLTRAYQGDGFLLLKNFSLEWKSGNSLGDTSASLQMDMAGEKVFLR
ncbi:hypothetical protein AZSI13_33860 [Azospira sp. I13]|uniref:hypothetical protein n=1 Tax=Azospira sp. I13 TaxID=1765050 RepID=UPI000D4F309A|nr:hypothetical protein [Azospira sp. I13]GBG04059.1 hypothetical protein AZSI13_33860 [Azospira sp. I13]